MFDRRAILLLLALAACLCASLLGVAVRMEPVAQGLEKIALLIEPIVPRGRLPTGWQDRGVELPDPLSAIVPFPENDPRFGRVRGLRAVIYYAGIPVLPLALLTWHAAVCGMALLVYRLWGDPPYLKSGQVSIRFWRLLAVAAWWSLPWIPLAYASQLLFVGVFRHHFESVNLTGKSSAWLPLALGSAGIGTIWLGAAAGHVLATSWILRRRVRALVAARPPSLCSRCGYSLEDSGQSTCPECGAPRPAALATFALGRKHLAGRWHVLVVGLQWLLVAALYSGPVLLPLLGLLLPQAAVDSVAHVWQVLTA